VMAVSSKKKFILLTDGKEINIKRKGEIISCKKMVRIIFLLKKLSFYIYFLIVKVCLLTQSTIRFTVLTNKP
jgi:hypothetical protein